MQHRAQAARLRPLALALVVATAADAMHAFGQVDGLEVGGEGAHQVGGLDQPGRAEDIDQLVHAQAGFAPRDGGATDALDLVQEPGPDLLGQDLADQRTEGADVVAQQLVAGGEITLAQILAQAGCVSKRIHGKPDPRCRPTPRGRA